MRAIKALAVFLACLLFCTPSYAGLTLNWHTTASGTTFSWGSGTSMSVGTEHAASSCGTFSNNDVGTIEVSNWTNGGGTPSSYVAPAGWTKLFEDFDTNAGDTGGAFFYKKLSGSESCPLTVSWTNSSAGGGQAWQIQEWTCTGSNPSSVVDNSAHAGDFIAAGAETAPSIASLTNSTDQLMLIYFDQGKGQPYVQPTGATAIDNTIGTNPGNQGVTQLLTSYKTLSSNAATGAITASQSSTFVRYVGAQVALNVCTGGSSSSYGGLMLGTGVGH